MSTKKQISSLCKLYSKYEEIPEEFLDETDEDSYFYHNISDISVPPPNSSSQQRIQQKVFWIQSLSFLRLKVTAAIYFQRKSQHFKNGIESLLDSLGELFKTFDQTNKKYRRFHYPNLNLRLDLQQQKTNCSVIVAKI